MRRIVIAAAMSLFVVSLATVVSADTLVLRDGSRIEGTVLAIAGRTITFRHADGASHRYPTSRVNSLEFFSADRDNPRATKVRGLEVPAGTELAVRTAETKDATSRSLQGRSSGFSRTSP
jgi:small-conductance mechanosensitive channel